MTTYKKHLTDEFIDAIDTVCAACPYISNTLYEANEKYCERCMVRRMYELFYAEDENGDYLPMSAPEWQAIINY